jgi:hypothetical protein
MAPFEKSIAYQSQTAQVFCLGRLFGGKWAITVSEMRLSVFASSSLPRFSALSCLNISSFAAND